MFFTFSLLLLATLVLVPLATLVAASCRDEVKQAGKMVRFLTACFLLVATATLLYGQANVWLQLVIVVGLAVLFFFINPYFLARLVTPPLLALSLYAPTVQGRAGMAALLLALLAGSVTQARVPKKGWWRQALLNGLKADLPLFGVGLLLLLLFALA